jgi:(R,R)-butanediol dehydrogenase/meso-butanediol dehydrogenase/diacetyl reductase
MRAAYWYGKKDVRIEEIADSQPGPGQVRLRVKACGICGTDLHEYNEGPFLIPSRPHPLTGMDKGPVILGHEFSAEVESIGQEVDDFTGGERVTVNPLLYCGVCPYCRSGEFNMCVKLGTIGLAADGAFAEYVVVPGDTLHRLPDNVDDVAGAFVEPLAVAIRAVKRSRLEIGQTAAVIGAGPIGLLVLQALINCGASRVFVVEPMPQRRKLALELGAVDTVDPTVVDPGKQIATWTENLRVDRAFECVGNQNAFDTAVKVTGRRAVICQVGMALTPTSVNFLRLWGHEKEITTSSGYSSEFPAAIALLSEGRVNIDPLVTSKIPLGQLVEKGFEVLADSRQDQIKVIVEPGMH